jgi:hypothetical protein
MSLSANRIPLRRDMRWSSREPQELAAARRRATTNKMHNTRQNASQFRHLGGRWFRRVIGIVHDAVNNGSTRVANMNSRTSNELRNLVLILTAEGTMKKPSKEHACLLREREKSSTNDILSALRWIKRGWMRSRRSISRRARSGAAKPESVLSMTRYGGNALGTRDGDIELSSMAKPACGG